jgi:hypothetical protein
MYPSGVATPSCVVVGWSAEEMEAMTEGVARGRRGAGHELPHVRPCLVRQRPQPVFDGATTTVNSHAAHAPLDDVEGLRPKRRTPWRAAGCAPPRRWSYRSSFYVGSSSRDADTGTWNCLTLSYWTMRPAFSWKPAYISSLIGPPHRHRARLRSGGTRPSSSPTSSSHDTWNG